jgi:hypothetical protein
VIILAFLAEAKEPALLCCDRDVSEYVSYITFKDYTPLTRSDNTVKDLINKDIRNITLIKRDIIVNKVPVKEEEIINTLLVTIVLYNKA